MKTSFDCGWNDTVYGMATADGPQGLLRYIREMRAAAQSIVARSDYPKGAMAAIDEALKTGDIPAKR